MSVEGVTNSNPVYETESPDQITGDRKPSGSSANSLSPATTIGNLAELKEKAPEVYKKMLEGIFQEVRKQSSKHEKMMKKIRQESNR